VIPEEMVMASSLWAEAAKEGRIEGRVEGRIEGRLEGDEGGALFELALGFAEGARGSRRRG